MEGWWHLKTKSWMRWSEGGQRMRRKCGLWYIGSKDVVVWTDNVTLKYFATQPKLSSKQVRWQDIRHKLGKENVVSNALSQKHQLKVVYVGEIELQKEVWLASYQDEFAMEVKQNIQKGIKSHFHLQNGLLWHKQNQLYVSEGRFKDVLLKECHDGPLAGHGGAKHTTKLLKKSYWWLNSKDDAKGYVMTCLTCQQNWTLNKNKQDCCNHNRFRKGHGKVCPWISWWVSHHQGDLMWSWWWWIDLARWHTSFPPRKLPQPKRWESCSSHTCSNIMASQRTLC